MRELASILIMLFAVALLIRWGDWILANLDDALGVQRTANTSPGRGADQAARRGSHHHSSRPVSHSGRAVK